MGGIALTAIFAASAAAETRYDCKLEKAVMGVVVRDTLPKASLQDSRN
ncbi:hypothetical protein [Mesorhizobium sp.]|nr:hypothetical protein [Mesorhizobium sp.]